jgi:hypothetical protein
MHEMQDREELDPDWQAHYQIAAKLWNVLYGNLLDDLLP